MQKKYLAMNYILALPHVFRLLQVDDSETADSKKKGKNNKKIRASKLRPSITDKSGCLLQLEALLHLTTSFACFSCVHAVKPPSPPSPRISQTLAFIFLNSMRTFVHFTFLFLTTYSSPRTYSRHRHIRQVDYSYKPHLEYSLKPHIKTYSNYVFVKKSKKKKKKNNEK